MNKRFTRSALAAAVGLLVSAGALADDISPDVIQQIKAIQAVKANFSPAQKKMDSALAFGILGMNGDPSVASFTNAMPTIFANDVSPTQSSGTATANASSLVNVEFSGDTDAIAAAVNAVGGTVVYSAKSLDSLTAAVPLSSVASIAASNSVTSAKIPSGFTTHVGSLLTQGYISHEANKVVGTLGITGAGVKVGVISDSASAARVAALIASGDLGPNTTVLAGQASSGSDEGTAMMEIVQDMAPGAQLIFATANGGQAQFAANILALAAQGCKVIVDDVSYFAESAFQDGTVAAAINTVTAAGVTYFSSAGNSGSVTKNTSGTWEGDFLSGGAVSGPIATAGETGLVHNFGSGASPQNYDPLTAVTTAPIFLKWSDPNGASSNDYDFFLLNSTGTTLKTFSAAAQDGTVPQEPYEAFSCTQTVNNVTSQLCAVGDRLVVVLFNGATRALHIDTNRAKLAIATTGATTGHNAAAAANTMAATFWNSAKTGTKAFTGFPNTNESFSSDGPRRIFYNPNGTPIGGGVTFASGGGTLLQKPDFAAADGVSTRTPGFTSFYGTSAAAPHAAGIAALIMQARPNYTPAQVKAAMRATALDSMGAGVDRDSGYGIAMAYAAVQYAIAHP